MSDNARWRAASPRDSPRPYVTPVEAVTRTACAGPCRVATLDHESGYHPVEDGPIEEVIARKKHEVVHRAGRVLRVESNSKGTHVSCEDSLVVRRWINARRWGFGERCSSRRATIRSRTQSAAVHHSPGRGLLAMAVQYGYAHNRGHDNNRNTAPAYAL